MKKLWIVIVFVLIAALIGGGVYFLSQRRDPSVGPSGTSGDVQQSGEATKYLADEVVIESGFHKVTTDHKFIDCVYPKIKSFKNASQMNYINNLIQSDINEYRNEIDIRVDEQTEAVEQYRYIVSYEKLTYDKYLFLVVSHDYNTGGIRSIKTCIVLM